MSEREISDTEFTSALARGHAEATTEVRARAVRYLADRDVLEIETTRNGGFMIPYAWIGALQGILPRNSRSSRYGPMDRRSNSKRAIFISAWMVC